MSRYRRPWPPGGTWVFTVALADRRSQLLVERAVVLRAAMRTERRRRPFRIEAAVVLPDHLHMIWRLPPGDTDFATRWSAVRAAFSRGVPPGEALSAA